MNARSEIEQAEETLRRAMMASDVAQLDEMLSDACVFTNQDGVPVQGRRHGGSPIGPPENR